jgi:hypothetical protein
MPQQVIAPQVKNNSVTRDLLTIGGGVVGGVLGAAAGGVGAVPGAAAGATVGQMAGGLVAPDQEQTQALPQSGAGEAAAMARKQQQMSQDNLATLKQAEAALPQLPEGLRQQYAPAIVQARMMEQQQRGLA